MTKVQGTVLEIDVNALQYNYNYFKSKLKVNTKIIAVIKAFGYGTDAFIIANYLDKLGVDYFAVAYVEEGVSLRKQGIQTPIIVLHPQIVSFKACIQYKLEPNIYSQRILEAFIAVAKTENQQEYPIHIKFNTGLNRLGFTKDVISSLIEEIMNTSALKIASIFSHLVASEDLNEKEFSLQQISTFKNITTQVLQQLPYQPMLHMLNTSGVLNYPEAQFDMVRIGIGLLGFANDSKETEILQNVVSLKSIISQIHTIGKGETVGYNRAYTAEKTMRTATIPIGHADGIHRALGNGLGSVKIQDKEAVIIGNVCMDMLLVDITTIACKEGDEVILFNTQKMVNNLAQKSQTISYEILTATSQRVKRIVK